jgi:hypothetical protein
MYNNTYWQLWSYFIYLIFVAMHKVHAVNWRSLGHFFQEPYIILAVPYVPIEKFFSANWYWVHYVHSLHKVQLYSTLIYILHIHIPINFGTLILQNLLFLENKDSVWNGLTRIQQNGVPQQELCKDKCKHFTNQYKTLLTNVYLTILNITRIDRT